MRPPDGIVMKRAWGEMVSFSRAHVRPGVKGGRVKTRKRFSPDTPIYWHLDLNFPARMVRVINVCCSSFPVTGLLFILAG